MATTLNYTYNYSFESGLYQTNIKQQLSLATSDLNHESPYFFDGKMLQPRIIADMLLTVSDVVRTHFFLPMPALMDPVLTSSENILRIEGFSGCCGVYVRADLPVRMFEGECYKSGTTNVDFNQKMRLALGKIRDQQKISFSIGKSEVVLTQGENKIIEKKVKMPVRWIKGFGEVSSYLPKLQLKMQVNAAQALRFIRFLPNSSLYKKPVYAVLTGKNLRISHQPVKNSVPILGTHRVKVIEPLLFRAKTLRVWADDENGCSAWEVCFEVGSFFLMISPEVFRGFSGEGQLLQDLAKSTDEKLINNVKAQLLWQANTTAIKISQLTSIPQQQVANALSILASRGLIGYDAFEEHYYYRQLPFDFEKVESLQSRLKNARKLIETGKIKRLSNKKTAKVFEIPGTQVKHRVTLGDAQNYCTCPWFSKYQGKRGICKHILAAQLFEDLMEKDP